MCSRYSYNNSRNSDCGCGNNTVISNNAGGCGCNHSPIGSAYDNNGCGCGNNSVGSAYDNNGCGCGNNSVGSAYDNNSCGCGCDNNLLACAANGFASTVFRVVNGLDNTLFHDCGCGCDNRGNRGQRNCGCN